MSERVRVLLVDDHPMVRRGLKLLLEEQSRVAVVAEARDARSALAVCADLPCDVAIIDLSLPGNDGLFLTRQLRQSRPDLRLLVLTARSDEGTAVDALRAGAHGYLHKSSQGRDLVRAVLEVHQHGCYLTPMVLGPVLRELGRGQDCDRPALEALTAREREILRQAASGRLNRDIAASMGVSESTIKSSLRSIYRKIRVTDRTQAILLAVRSGMVSRPSGQN